MGLEQKRPGAWRPEPSDHSQCHDANDSANRPARQLSRLDRVGQNVALALQLLRCASEPGHRLPSLLAADLHCRLLWGLRAGQLTEWEQGFARGFTAACRRGGDVSSKQVRCAKRIVEALAADPMVEEDG